MATQLSEGATHAWKTRLAFAIIYFVWGSTFLAIRLGVQQVPPLLLAALRFMIAGLVLCAWSLIRGEELPSGRQWGAIALLAFLIFAVDYGILFWAEQRVPSGVAAVILATIPAFMALAEIILLGTQRFTARLAFALLIGLTGVAVLVNPSWGLGGKPVYALGAGALVLGAMSWSVASALARKVPLPASKFMSAGAQMLVGGLFLCVAAYAFGEFRRFEPLSVSNAAWMALLYLIVAGSIMGFTAYVWLISRESPTKVGTYAYVNPVIAVLIGYFVGGEALGLRTVLGMVAILISILVIRTAKSEKVIHPAPHKVGQ